MFDIVENVFDGVWKSGWVEDWILSRIYRNSENNLQSFRGEDCSALMMEKIPLKNTKLF